MRYCSIDRQAVANVRISEIPTYLHKSDFYRNLDTNSDDSFTILIVYYKPNPIVSNLCDFEWLLETIRYWGLDDILPFLLEDPKPYMASCCSIELLEEYESEMPYLKNLQEMFTFRNSPHELLQAAIRSGSVDLVEYVCESQTIHWDLNYLSYAAEYDNVKCLKYAYDHGCTIRHSNIFHTAVKHGHLDCVRFLHEMQCRAPHDICCTAVRSHHMHVLKYLLSVHYQAHGTVHSAIKVDDEIMLCFLHTELRYPLPADASHCAARLDSLSCLQYLLQRNYPLTMQLYLEAARSRGTKCLAYLHQQGCPRDVRACMTGAVEFEKWKPLQFLLSQEQYERNIIPQIVRPSTLLKIVPSGESTLLHILIKSNCHFTTKVAKALVSCNDFASLALALQHNCDRSAEICAAAAYHGHLECLQLAHEAGCPWDDTVCTLAIENGHLDCLQYAHEHGCPWQLPITIRSHHTECLQYAEQHGCVIGRRCSK